jgi:hypothetical protein
MALDRGELLATNGRLHPVAVRMLSDTSGR